MGKVVELFQPTQSDGAKNLSAFITHARNELTIYSECVDKDGLRGWESNIWWFKNKIGKPLPMVFSLNDADNVYASVELFKAPFIEFAKAYIRELQTIKELTSVQNHIAALRYIYRALEEANRHESPNVLNWDARCIQICLNLLEQAKMVPHYRYVVACAVKRVHNFLQQKRIVASLPVFKSPFKKPRHKTEILGEEGDKWREERCPSMHQMMMVAEAFRLAQAPQDKYWSSVIVLLLFAPSRLHELNGLTIDSLQQEPGTDKWYVSWYSAKGFGATKKWIPTVFVDVVKEAFARLIEIGEPARMAARFAAKNPGVFMRHAACITPVNFPEDALLSSSQFASAMGINSTQDSMQTKWVKKLADSNSMTYRGLANYVSEKYSGSGFPINPTTKRPVHDNLLLHRENEFHKDFPAKQFSWVMPTHSSLSNQISPRRTLKHASSTLFQRLNLKDEGTDENGNQIDIDLSSHQFRVWLNTHAMDGGMSEHLLAQWSGRADITQNRAYDLRTKSQKDRSVLELMRYPLSEVPPVLILHDLGLKPHLRQLGVDRDGVADFTGLGFCVHNYAESPCTKKASCETCSEHVCVKGLPNALEELKALEALTADSYEKAVEAAGDNTFGADRWVTHLHWKLAHLRTIIQIMENPSMDDGIIIRIPPQHDPSDVSQALASKELKITTGNESVVLDLKRKLLGF
jgi:hypothetical protein